MCPEGKFELDSGGVYIMSARPTAAARTWKPTARLVEPATTGDVFSGCVADLTPAGRCLSPDGLGPAELGLLPGPALLPDSPGPWSWPASALLPGLAGCSLWPAAPLWPDLSGSGS